MNKLISNGLSLQCVNQCTDDGKIWNDFFNLKLIICRNASRILDILHPNWNVYVIFLIYTLYFLFSFTHFSAPSPSDAINPTSLSLITPGHNRACNKVSSNIDRRPGPSRVQPAAASYYQGAVKCLPPIKALTRAECCALCLGLFYLRCCRSSSV